MSCKTVQCHYGIVYLKKRYLWPMPGPQIRIYSLKSQKFFQVVFKVWAQVCSPLFSSLGIVKLSQQQEQQEQNKNKKNPHQN